MGNRSDRSVLIGATASLWMLDVYNPLALSSVGCWFPGIFELPEAILFDQQALPNTLCELSQLEFISFGWVERLNVCEQSEHCESSILSCREQP